MLCISVFGDSINEIKSRIFLADMAEIRIDMCNIELEDISGIYKLPKPLIATCRVDNISANKAKSLYEEAINYGVKYIDIDIDFQYAEDIARKAILCSSCNVIFSYHNYFETPSSSVLSQIVDSIKEKCFEISKESYYSNRFLIKIACFANNLTDVENVISLYAQHLNLIAFCMGDIGKESRVLSLKYGAPFAYVSFDENSATAYGQYTYTEMRKITSNLEKSTLVKSSEINGEINAYPSKSITQRMIAGAILAGEGTEIENPSYCNDAKVSFDIAKSFGYDLQHGNNKILFRGKLNLREIAINCVESGMSARMFSAFSGLTNDKIIIDGNESLRSRPMQMIVDGLKALGVECMHNNGFLPLEIQGKFKNTNVTIDGSLSSQFLSGLLFVLPFLPVDSELVVKNLKSKPYIDLTIEIINLFGVKIENDSYETFKIKGNQKYKIGKYFVEGDWSGAAFFIVAASIAGKVKINNLYANSLQGDKAILNVIKDFGAKVDIKSDYVVVEKYNSKAFKYNAEETPDLVPSLVALAINAEGESVISGISRLKYKESSRAEVLVKEFSKLGADIKINCDSIIIKGGTLKGGVVSSNNDHRIAMALMVAGLKSESIIEIEGVECISKSYPGFEAELKKLIV